MYVVHEWLVDEMDTNEGPEAEYQDGYQNTIEDHD